MEFRRRVVGVAVTKEQHRALNVLADAAGLTVSDYIYQGLIKLGYIAEPSKAPASKTKAARIEVVRPGALHLFAAFPPKARR
jgi:hypothetical protein